MTPEIPEIQRAYRVLSIRSYVRFEQRVNASGVVFVIEPNANPCARNDELAQSALKAGIKYPALIRRS